MKVCLSRTLLYHLNPQGLKFWGTSWEDLRALWHSLKPLDVISGQAGMMDSVWFSVPGVQTHIWPKAQQHKGQGNQFIAAWCRAIRE